MNRIEVKIDVLDILEAMLPQRSYSHIVDKNTVIDFKPTETFDDVEELKDHIEELINMIEGF